MIYDGKSFRMREYIAFTEGEGVGAVAHLSVNNVEVFRGRVNGYAEKREEIIEVTKIDDYTVEIKFTGNIYT